MDLIVEDGTGVLNANSYISLDDAHTYAQARGFDDLFTDDDVLSQWLIKGMDYIESIVYYQGVTSYTDQFLLWPRTGVYLDGSTYNKFGIPKQLRAAQVQLALAQAKGIDLTTYLAADAAFIKLEKVGPLETEYFQAPDIGGLTFEAIDLLLAPLQIGYGGGLRTLRV